MSQTSSSQNNPVISVIVAAYNQEKYISRCLRSLLNQKFARSEFEIVVINDASTDRTANVLQEFADDIVLLTNESNLGLPASLNRAIRRARSQYVVRVDSDDYVNSEFLHLLHTFLRENRYMDAVACDYLLVDEQEEVIARNNCIEIPIACGIMFRAEQLIDIGLYDETFLLHEETDLRLRFTKKYRIHRLELPLYRYRRHANNLTNDFAAMEHHRQRIINKHGQDSSQ